MEALFCAHASHSAHQSLVLRDPGGGSAGVLLSCLNHKPLLAGWRPLAFEFVGHGVKRDSRHAVLDICTIYARGVLAFRADLKERLFPVEPNLGLEFLPIGVGVDAEPWLLLNCLNAVKAFDEEKSRVVRALNGDVSVLHRLTVTDPVAWCSELFTVAHTQRTQLFVRPVFKSRVEHLRLKGLTFQRVGDIVCQPRGCITGLTAAKVPTTRWAGLPYLSTRRSRVPSE